MKIEKKLVFLKSLKRILLYIKIDKPTAASNFEKELNKRIKLLSHNPLMHRKSQSFDDEAYRDLIYKGYTIIYKVEGETIMILDIFKWQDR